MEGWVKLHRRLIEWEWWGDHSTTILFIYLLLKANHKDNKWCGMTIGRGQLVTGRIALAEATGLTEQNIRTSLKRLKSTSEITIKVTNRFSIITLNKYSDYQHQLTSQTTSELTNNQPATNQQLTTNKNVKNDKNVKKSNILTPTSNQIGKLKQQFPGVNVKLELRKANDYIKAEGVIKKDYMAWFRNWLRRLAPEKTKLQSKKPLTQKITEKQRLENLKRIEKIKEDFGGTSR